MISLEGVKKRYDGTSSPSGRRRTSAEQSPLVVNGVDLTVRQGELLVLLGESGCGKTTTLKMINRLEEPTEGTITVNGEVVIDIQNGQHRGGWKPDDLPAKRRQIGYVIQGSGLLPHMTVAENIAIVPRLLGPKAWPEERIRGRVDELLDLIDLPPREFRDRPADKLSGGQAQRVGFARAVAARPPVMLLDEPFGALDPIKREEVRQAFHAIRAREKVTAVMVTHDMTEALLLGDRIAVMHEGRVVQWDEPQALLNDPKTPYVRQFIQGPLEETRKVEKLLGRATAGGAA